MDTSTLQRHCVLHGVSADTVSAHAQQRIAQHQVRPSNGRQIKEGYLHHVSLGSMAVANLGFGAETLIDGFPTQDNYYIQIVLSGQLDVCMGGHSYSVDSNAMAIINPMRPALLHHSADCCALIVRIERSAMQQHLTDLLGHTVANQVEFTPFVLRNQQRVGSLIRSIEHICAELEDPYATIHTPKLARIFESQLTDTFFWAVPHSHSDRVERVIGSDGPECLLRAERYVDSHLALDLSLADMVLASGTSERNLYKAFRTYRDLTPMGYLKAQRLRKARRELESSRNPNLSIAEIAMEVGLSHLGNFSADYKRMFGELPSETLRRRNRALY